MLALFYLSCQEQELVVVFCDPTFTDRAGPFTGTYPKVPSICCSPGTALALEGIGTSSKVGDVRYPWYTRASHPTPVSFCSISSTKNFRTAITHLAVLNPLPRQTALSSTPDTRVSPCVCHGSPLWSLTGQRGSTQRVGSPSSCGSIR
jgi:hypothetical protein